MFQRRVVGLVLASFAVVLMGFSLLSHRWWAMKEGDESVAFGLRTVELCDEDYDDGRTREDCRTMSLGKMFRGEDGEDRYDEYDAHTDGYPYDEPDEGKEPTSFIMVGNLAFFGGIAAGILLAICAGSVLINAHARANKNLGIVTAVACGIYGGAALLLVVMAPDQLKDIPLGLAVPLALVGGGVGLCAGLVLSKFDPASEPRPLPSAQALSGLTGLAPSKVPSMVLAGFGVLLVAGAIFTNTWWGRSEDDFKVSVGLREAESCHTDSYDYGSYDRERRGREKCQSQTLQIRESRYDDDDDGASSMKTFLRAGAVTYHVGVMLLVLTLLAGTLMVAGQRLPGPITPAALVIGAAAVFLLGALIYLASKPSMMKDLHASFGPVLALTGGGCLIGAGVAIGRFMPVGMTASPGVWDAGPMMMPGPMMPPGAMMPPGPMGVPLAPYHTPHTPIPGTLPAVSSGPITPACPQCAAPMVFTPQHGRWFCASCRIYA